MRWPAGFRSAGVAAGIKDDAELDLGMVVCSEAASWAGVFTTNSAAAACVDWCKARGGGPARVVVANSGNANACTGPEGEAAVEKTAKTAAGLIGCDAHEVLVASTGPIGVVLPIERVVSALPGAAGSLEEDVDAFARSIMTTDTRTKTAAVSVGGCSIVGVAKGAAMLAPNMATMLAFVATDARLDAKELQSAISFANKKSFDRICVDACQSTNDSVLVLASGLVTGVDVGGFAAGLEGVCRDLAEQMARDAEGGTKLVRITVGGADSEDEAAVFGRAVASSALWRAAVHGADPNWGRVVAALGSAGGLDLRSTEIAIGTETVFARGEPVGDMERARKQMTEDEIDVTCVVGHGTHEAQILTTDLSPDYVTLNAWGTT